MRLVAYVRVSDVSENIENQRYAILEFAAKNGHQLVDVFEDVGISGALPPLERPGFSKAFSALRDCDGLIVYALDRVARSLLELVDVVKRIESISRVVISVREPWINRLDPRVRSLIVAVLGWARRDGEGVHTRAHEGGPARSQGSR